MKRQALQVLNHRKSTHIDQRLELVALAIRGSSSGAFDKVVGIIYTMVALLGKGQTDDNDKKAYYDANMDKSEDDLKILNEELADLGAVRSMFLA